MSLALETPMTGELSPSDRSQVVMVAVLEISGDVGGSV